MRWFFQNLKFARTTMALCLMFLLSTAPACLVGPKISSAQRSDSERAQLQGIDRQF